MSNIVYYMFYGSDPETMDRWASAAKQKDENIAERIFDAALHTSKHGLAHYATHYIIWCNLKEEQKSTIRSNVSPENTVVVALDIHLNEMTLIYPVTSTAFMADGSSISQRAEILCTDQYLYRCKDGQYYRGTI